MFHLKRDKKSYFLLTAFAALLMLISFVLPSLLGAAVRVLASALLAVIVVNYHYRLVAAACAVTLAVTLLAGGFVGLLYAGVMYVLLGISVGMGINLKLPLFRLVLLAALAYLTVNVGMLWYTEHQPDSVAMSTLLLQMGEEINQLLAGAYQDLLSAEQLEQLGKLINQMVSVLIVLLPAILIVVSILVAYFTVAITKILLRKNVKNASYLTPFCDVRADKVSAAVFPVLFVLSILPFSPMVSDVLLNLVYVMCWLFYLFGLALINWFMIARGMQKMPRTLFLTAIVLSVFIFTFFPLLVIIGLGVLDGFFDFRKRSGMSDMMV